MSHIDSFDHELVGILGGLPVYHPLEKIEGDFICDKNQLVLGGGSGEHPAVVIENPTGIVAYFLNEILNEIEELKSWKEIIEPYLIYDLDELLTFYDWDIETYSSFYKRSKAKSLLNPSNGNNIEEWLILGFGEFIFYSMPELAKELMVKLEDPYKHFKHIRYNNILIVPPNFPVYAKGGNKFF
ncbi:hypothetical protein NE848_16490 [Gramella jeungdoensis]|uniref:Uncharacterized protein n=1 Tax=Gramella jeungdoensis TaxID=708091 RepID=A0ABT0Z5J7_9FLAO|nr:hypothetical protein [Gramella jeungdoensis]MCM8570998.1 hypothetical protein [Gramella jeungdoensis]